MIHSTGPKTGLFVAGLAALAAPFLADARSAPGAVDDRAMAAALMTRADKLRQEGSKSSTAEVRALYGKSISLWRSAHDGCGARRAWVALSGFEHDLVNAEAQKRAAEAALKEMCLEDVQQQALAERLLGSAFINQGDFAAGIGPTERAVELFRQTGDEREESGALRNLGLAYAESGDVDKGLATTHLALELAQRNQDSRLLALLRTDIALSHNARGEFALAIEAYRQALNDSRAHPNPTADAVAWINLGLAYGQLGDSAQALAAYDEGAAIAGRIECWSCLAEIEVDRADDLVDAGDFARAEEAYGRALDLSNQHQLVRQHAEAQRGLARCALERGQWSQARSRLESARRELARTHGRLNESVVYTLLGNLEERTGHPTAARQDYTRALSLARASANEAWQAAAYASLARLAQQSDVLDVAKHNIEQAIALIESERSHIDAPDLRTSYFGTKRSYYGLYIDILMQLARERANESYAAQALTVAERARARALQDQLAQRAITVDARIDPKLLAEERETTDHLHAWAYQLAQLSPGEQPKRQELQARIDAASRQLDEVRGHIRAANPRYAELTHPSSVRPEAIQHELLDDKVSVLEFWLGERQSYLWVVTQDALSAFTLPARSIIEPAARDLRDQLLAGTQIPSSVSIEQRAAKDAALLKDLSLRADVLRAAILPSAARPLLRRVVAVVPDGILQLVPFAFLCSAGEANASAASTYVNLPSISTLRSLRMLPRSRAAPGALAVIADPVFRADDDRLRLSAERTTGNTNASHDALDVAGGRAEPMVLRAVSEAGVADLARLPHSREEAQAIAALADPRASWIALDFAASRSAALAASWPSYSIVHFATHSLINARHPELSGIVLSLYDVHGKSEDGFLRMSDIYNMRVPADLVVLSVCDSAVGKDVGSEGPANLARAFFYAGARRVIASLWPVDDRASVAFMRELYSGMLRLGLAPQDALTRAQRELQQNPRWRAPYYWAPFVLEGDWE
jgi:CHAT domain-containing protein